MEGQVKQGWIARLTFNIRKEWKSKKKKQRELQPKVKAVKRKIRSKDIFKLFFEEGHRTSCEQLESLLVQNPNLKGLRILCLLFRAMMNRSNRAIELRQRIEKAYNYGIPMIKKFAIGLMAEQQAVQEAIDCPWSNGLAEGTVNRVKNIKRQMYGRAGFELLKRKVILAKWG